MNDTRSSSERISFLVVLAALVAGFVWMMRPFWAPAGIAAVTAVLFLPIHERILARCKGRRYAAATLSLVAVCLFVLLPFSALVAVLVSEIFRFSQVIASHLQEGQLAAILDRVNHWVTMQVQRLGELAPADFDLKSTLVQGVQMIGGRLYKFPAQVLSSTADVSLSTAIWMLFVFVFLAEGKRLFEFLMDLSPLASVHERQIAREVREMVAANFFAILVTAAINAVLIGILFAFSPIDRALVWAAVVFGLSFVPLLGAAAVWVTGAVYLWTTGHGGWALSIVIFGLTIIAQTDNVVKPLVMRGRVNIHPVLLMLSLIAGAKAMGPTGLLFGPVFVAILQACLRIWRLEFGPAGEAAPGAAVPRRM